MVKNEKELFLNNNNLPAAARKKSIIVSMSRSLPHPDPEHQHRV